MKITQGQNLIWFSFPVVNQKKKCLYNQKHPSYQVTDHNIAK